jgi:glyoxylase-like metal-dependent hydrolase (beta-lactamase superfamily II)
MIRNCISKKANHLPYMLLTFLVFVTASVYAASPWDPADVKLKSHQLKTDVYAVLPHDAFDKDHVATTAGFIIGDKGVLVIESMVNGHLASQLIGEIRKVTTKPIRYLVNTSYHGDHSYGNFVFPKDTVIIQHIATKHYIDEKFKQDQEFMLGLMGPGKGIEEVVPRSADVVLQDRLTIDLGNKQVELLHFGFAQTAGDVVVWLPEEKILWVGNMIQAPPPALPWLLEGRHKETITTLTKLKEFLPADATIIPGHGKPMTTKEINFSINYLKKLEREIKRSIEEGLTLDETIQRMDLPEYSQYSLYEFAHKKVNVPAVYRELKK